MTEKIFYIVLTLVSAFAVYLLRRNRAAVGRVLHRIWQSDFGYGMRWKSKRYDTKHDGSYDLGVLFSILFPAYCALLIFYLILKVTA